LREADTDYGHRRDEFFLASKCGCPLEFPADPDLYEQAKNRLPLPVNQD
jgi:hypothetical protein